MAKKSSISGDYDNLIVRNLRGPLLDQVMQSKIMRNELMNVAREIKTRYIAKVPKDTGALSKTVRIKPFRAETRDRRWYVDVTIGGIMGVDYADQIEAQYHVLGDVLRDMGYNVGDFVSGPRGRGAKETPDKIMRAFQNKARDERMSELRASSDPQVQRYMTQLDKFSKPGRDLDTAAIKMEYMALRNSTLNVQAKYGNESARFGYDAMRDYRGARMMSGMSGHPMEMRGGRAQLDQEMMNERRGERGGVTWEMQQAGIQSPYDRGESDPLTNYFSDDELRYYGRDPDSERGSK